MIHVCGAWILPAIACLPQIMDKFYIIHFSNLHDGLTDRFYLAGVEILNSRSANFSFYILWHYSTVYNCVPLYLNDYQLLLTRNETKSI